MTLTSVELNEALVANAEHKAVHLDLGGKALTITAADIANLCR